MSFLNTVRFGVATAALLASSCSFAAAVVGAFPSSSNGNTPSATDIFDVSQGTTIVSASPQNPGSDARSALGFHNATFPPDPDNAYFLDGLPTGSVSQITFRLASATQVGGYNFYTFDDSFVPNNSNRGIVDFRLFGSADGISFDLLSSATVPGHPYVPNQVPIGNALYITDSFTPVQIQFLRLEVTRFNTTGPRIFELDGVSAVPIPAALYLLGPAFSGIAFMRRRA